MNIQNILFPSKDNCMDWEMYFRGGEGRRSEGKRLYLPKGNTLSLESYFNAFSIGKWTTYTRLDNLQLALQLTGKVNIKGYHVVGKKDAELNLAAPIEEIYTHLHTTREEIDIVVEQQEHEVKITFPQLFSEGILYVTVEALEDVCFEGGAYLTDVKAYKNVDLALGICTFRREKELQRNLDMIQKNIMENDCSPLYQHVEIYISDNGHTLDKKDFPSEHIHLFPNKNAGGAGGFTRTMIEAVLRKEGKQHTHLILMDDDIQLDTNVLERTQAFLQLIKSEYQDAFLGGAMLELEKRYQQFENGASFTGINLTSYNHGWDLRRPECLAANEEENPINYTGWWYCCIPTQVIQEDNLPLPQFIHYDDIEYGVRNAEPGVILVNGICVWHPYGNNKQPVSMNYYDLRNVMIAMAGSKHPCTKWQAAIRFIGTVVTETIRYRYRSAELFFRGIEDYYKGPEYFMALDPVENHQMLMSLNDCYEEPIDIDLSKVENRTVAQSIPHCAVWGTLCWFLPAMKKERYIGIYDTGIPYFTKRLYFYDENRGKGFWMEKSYKTAFAYAGRCIKDTVMILREHDKMKERWKSAKPEYTSLAYWEKYLELK